jgi:hypothetical protein
VSRYSQLYIDQPAPLPDSKRARHRLAKLMEAILDDFDARKLSNILERELGVEVGVYHNHHFTAFCTQCSVRDFLDTVTVATGFFNVGIYATEWLTEARRIFSEERLAYEIDDNGVVHPAVDKEFQRNRQATVAGLQMPRYANSLAAFERISDELASQPPNGKEAWRAVFTSVEGLFKLMFPSAQRLNAAAVKGNLKSVVQKLHLGIKLRNKLRTGRSRPSRTGSMPHTTTDTRLAAKNQCSRRLIWRCCRSAVARRSCGG